MHWISKAPLLLVTVVCLCLFTFPKFYLNHFADSYSRDVERQNYSELASGDTFALSSRLTQLSGTDHVSCIKGSYKSQIFFTRGETCDYVNFLERQVAINGVGDLVIYITLTLPKTLKIGLAVMSVFQLVLLVLLILALRITARRSALQKENLLDEVGRIVDDISRSLTPSFGRAVGITITDDLIKLRERILAIIAERDLLVGKNKIFQFAAQVAHDIRSPLAALNVLSRDLVSIPEERRVLLRNAVTRIQDIANNLLSKKDVDLNAVAQVEFKDRRNKASSELVSTILDSLISEKRLQFRDKLGIEMHLRLEPSSYGIFSSLNSAEFKRVLSNLINNAVEALPDNSGEVDLILEASGEKVYTTVQDNGIGISEDRIHHLMQRGKTFGKEGGLGLGLAHAKETIEAWGGEINLSSELGKGTKVLIVLPRASAPEWFLETLELYEESKVFVLDDDASIHGIWEGRFKSSLLGNHGIEVFHGSRPKEFDSHIKNLNPEDKILCDYEFLGETQNGLNWILENRLTAQAILVTSRFEESHIRETCEKENLKLLPKGLTPYVPIVVRSSDHKASNNQGSNRLDAVLIDDDPMMHALWKISAKQHNKNIRVFDGPDSFKLAAIEIDKIIPIYIDKNLGPHDGLDVAEDLFADGYKNIHIATGEDAADVPKSKFIKSVTGKDPPWAIGNS